MERLFPDVANSIKMTLSKGTLRLVETERTENPFRATSNKRPKTTNNTPRRFKKAKIVYQSEKGVWEESGMTSISNTADEYKGPNKNSKAGFLSVPQSQVMRAKSNPQTPTRSVMRTRKTRSEIILRRNVSTTPCSNIKIRPGNTVQPLYKLSTQNYKQVPSVSTTGGCRIRAEIEYSKDFNTSAVKRHFQVQKKENKKCRTLSWKSDGASIAEVFRVLARARESMDYSDLVPYEGNLRCKLDHALQEVDPADNLKFRKLFCAVCDFVVGIQCTTGILSSLLSSCIIKLGHDKQSEYRPEMLKRLHDSFTVLHSYEAGTVLQEIISKNGDPMRDKMCIDFAQMALDSLKLSNTRLTQIAIKNYNGFIKLLLERYSGRNGELVAEITKLVNTMDENVLPYQRTALGTEITKAKR